MYIKFSLLLIHIIEKDFLQNKKKNGYILPKIHIFNLPSFLKFFFLPKLLSYLLKPICFQEQGPGMCLLHLSLLALQF